MKFNKALLEYYGVDPARVPDFEEFWALYATSFYERLFGKMNDPKQMEATYKKLMNNPKLGKRGQQGLTFFYNLRRDELEDPNYWDKVGRGSVNSHISKNESIKTMKAKLVKESLNESVSRYCDIYKTQDGKWYMDLANEEYGEYDDCTTYGPFSSEDAADKYLRDNHSNPGGGWVDDSGERPVPKESPNGRPVVSPRSGRSYGGFHGGYGRF